MSARWQQASDGRVAFEGALTRETVPELWQQHDQWLQAEETLIIDLGAVEHVDSAGVALLIEAKVSLEKQQKQVQFENVSKQCRDIASVSGVAALLSLS
ncbi:hypothetical protein C9975_02440 [Thalassospira xiamenensis]|nr:hypothetical protein C9975_02440 [Thalassospira xiamenensis]